VVLLQVTSGEMKEENFDRINRINRINRRGEERRGEERGIATKRHEKSRKGKEMRLQYFRKSENTASVASILSPILYIL
jgi:hypothetical protein